MGVFQPVDGWQAANARAKKAARGFWVSHRLFRNVFEVDHPLVVMRAGEKVGTSWHVGAGGRPRMSAILGAHPELHKKPRPVDRASEWAKSGEGGGSICRREK